MRSRRIVAIMSVLLLAALPAGAQQARDTMTNADVISMVQAGLSRPIITQSIRTVSSVIFDVSPRALIALKAAGVADELLNEMIARAGGAITSSSPPRPGAAASPVAPATVAGKRAPSAADTTGPVSVADGTTVHLKLASALTSATAQIGDRPRFHALEDVKVGGVTVIAKGATAEGRVTDVRKAGALGRGGRLRVTIEFVRAVDDSVVRVRLDRTESGQARTGAAVTSVAVDASTGARGAARSAAGTLMAKGKEAAIPSNTEFTAFVDGAHEVVPAPASRQRSPAGGQR